MLLAGLLSGFVVSGDTTAPPVTCSHPHVPDGNGKMNSSLVFQAFPQPALVPWPTQIAADNKYLPINGLSIEAGSSDLWPLAQLLSEQIHAITNMSLPVRNATTAQAKPESIRLQVSAESLEADTSILNVDRSGILLEAGEYGALVSATTTLLQALENSQDVDSVPISGSHCTTPFSWRVPFLEIKDTPEFGFRGIMVDAARADLGTKTDIYSLKQYVILASFYKCNHLHIHLSDDDAFTWPSKAFPELAAQSSHAYTMAEMKELASFAALRGVAIIGEIDVPGHARGIVKALPELFAFPSSPHTGIVDITNPGSRPE